MPQPRWSPSVAGIPSQPGVTIRTIAASCTSPAASVLLARSVW